MLISSRPSDRVSIIANSPEHFRSNFRGSPRQGVNVEYRPSDPTVLVGGGQKVFFESTSCTMAFPSKTTLPCTSPTHAVGETEIIYPRTELVNFRGDNSELDCYGCVR